MERRFLAGSEVFFAISNPVMVCTAVKVVENSGASIFRNKNILPLQTALTHSPVFIDFAIEPLTG